MIVKLTVGELTNAAICGVFRRIQALSKRYHEPKGKLNLDPFGTDIIACAAELAYAKWSNQFWHSIGQENILTSKDVGEDQVRSTCHRDGCLVISERDPMNDPYVLVISVDEFTYDLKGWLWGREARERGEFKSPDGRKEKAWFVPQDQLRPLDTILRCRSSES